MNPTRPALLLIPLLLAGTLAHPVRAASAGDGLLDLSIEQLLDMEVTSASRKKQPLSQAATAVFVITQDDIRRSGARSIPEALRLAPGLQVAQIDANKWAITARGFMGRYANKLLVLMDGRTLYTPSFSVVFWDVQDTLMDNIERIEVIRGPGGTLWGSNAVNGIINIITRDARVSRDGLVTAGAGTQDAVSGALRLGGGDDALGYTGFVKYARAMGNRDATGVPTADDWRQARVGARLDWTRRDGETLTATAEAYSGRSGETVRLGLLQPPYVQRVDRADGVRGGFVLGRWTRQWSSGQESSVQLVLDTTHRETALFGEDHDSAEIEAQQHFTLGRHHDLVAGLNYRYNSFDFKRGTAAQFGATSPTDSRYSVFLQDEIALAGGHVLLTLGSKFEHNGLSPRDFEVLPNLRAAWQVAAEHTLWGAITGSVRTPSYADLVLTVTGVGQSGVIPPLTASNPLPLPLQAQIVGNPAIRSEKLRAYEIGYRGRLGQDLSLDLAAYLNDYSDVRGLQPLGLYCDSTGEYVDPAAPGACLFTSTSLYTRFQFVNSQTARSSGAELAVDWRASRWMRLVGSYSLMHVQRSAPIGPFQEDMPRKNPAEVMTLRAEITLRGRVELVPQLRYFGALATLDIPREWNADLRLAWRPRADIELALTGHDLLDTRRLHFIAEEGDLVPTQVERSLAASVRWAF